MARTAEEIQADIDSLTRMVVSGVLTLEVNGRKTTFRSMTDLLKAKAMLERELAGKSNGGVTWVVADLSQGVR